MFLGVVAATSQVNQSKNPSKEEQRILFDLQSLTMYFAVCRSNLCDKCRILFHNETNLVSHR